MKKKISMLLAILTVASSVIFSACSSKTDENASSTQTDIETASLQTETETEAVYPHVINALDGYEFTFLNCVDGLWSGSNHVIDYDESNGEVIQDSVFNRNRQAEEKFDCKFNVIKDQYFSLRDNLGRAVLSDDNVYDAAYNPIYQDNTSTLVGTYGVNLFDAGGDKLYNPWWNQTFIDAAVLYGDKLYSTVDYVNLMGYAYGNVMYFNKDMFTNLNVDMPYESVRSGSWTYDLMNQYMSYAVNINSDNSFAASSSGTCVYGYAVQHEEGTMSLLNGSGQFFVKKDGEGVPMLNESLEQISSAYDKLLNILSTEGYCVMKNTAELSGLSIFSQERAMFAQTALGCSADSFREYEFEYGVLPMPKLDEQQENYYTMISQYTLALVIPRSASNADMSFSVLDYLAYLSYRDVIPQLQNVLCYKGMRDEDSIDMLNVILHSSTLDIGFIFGWTSKLVTTLSGKLISGSSTFISDYEKNNALILASMEKTLSEMVDMSSAQ